jgi:hypothetical protein
MGAHGPGFLPTPPQGGFGDRRKSTEIHVDCSAADGKRYKERNPLPIRNNCADPRSIPYPLQQKKSASYP